MRSFSINDFCEMHSISRAYFYLLLKDGKAPKTFRLGRHMRITEQANNEWLANLEAAAA